MNYNYEELRNIYLKRLSDYLERNKYVVSDHIKGIMIDVVMARDNVNNYVGNFVNAIINNNLYEAVSYADAECSQNLSLIVKVRLNFSLGY